MEHRRPSITVGRKNKNRTWNKVDRDVVVPVLHKIFDESNINIKIWMIIIYFDPTIRRIRIRIPTTT